MGKKDPRVGDYIKKSADFARPVLKYLRRIVHTGCPAVEETIKWNFPHFEYQGVICGMAAFNEHCAFGFWKSALILENRATDAGMGQFGRITSIDDLPDEKTLLGYVRKAAQLNERGVKVPGRSAPMKRPPLKVPAKFATALKKNAKARKTFENLSPSNQREYVEWIAEAKRDDTRQRRLKTAIEWLGEGKPHNWRYLPASRR